MTEDVERSRAADLERLRRARDRYIEDLRTRGDWLDLRRLGFDLSPIQFDVAHGLIQVDDTSASKNFRLDPLLAFRRRGRVVLTGLPGSGKSTVVDRICAEWTRFPGWALPVSISLRRLAGCIRDAGFRQALVSLAVEDLSTEDATLVAAEIQRRLDSGDAVIFLDGLDEVGDDRMDLVASISRFLGQINPDTDVLIATRDVAYRQAATLGFSELRLRPPNSIEKTIAAVLEEAARSQGVVDDARSAWIRERQDWVKKVLSRDEELHETPLLPILLALLTVERDHEDLPRHRARILHAVIVDIVRRRELRRHGEFSIGPLRGGAAAAALLDAFAAEAAVLVEAGGSCQRTSLIQPLTAVLRDRWGLAPGPAEVTANEMVEFWDEAGIFVARGAERAVAPRLRVFLEIGESIRVAGLPAEQCRQWTRSYVENPDRHEMVLLAAGLSCDIADELALCAVRLQSRKVSLLCARAVAEGATPTEGAVAAMAALLISDLNDADRESWESFLALTRLPISRDLRQTALRRVATVLRGKSQLVARALAIIRWGEDDTDGHGDDILAELLRVEKGPERLPWRGSSEDDDHGYIYDEGRAFCEAIEGAARRLLPQRPDIAPLIAARIGKVPIATDRRLRELLVEYGHQAVIDALRPTKMLVDLGRALQEVKTSTDEIRTEINAFLEALRTLGKAENVSKSQERRCDELADLCETMNLEDFAAWWGWRGRWEESVDLIVRLGRFPPLVLARQAERVQRAIDETDDDHIFFGLFDRSARQPLVGWDALGNLETALRKVVSLFHWGRGTATVGAYAMMECPRRHEAYDATKSTLSSIRHPESRRIAAHTAARLASLRSQLFEEWVNAPDPVLRTVAIEAFSAIENFWQSIAPRVFDVDGNVRDRIVRTILKERKTRGENFGANLVEKIAKADDPGWLCFHCGMNNRAGQVRCASCSLSGPSPASTATTPIGSICLDDDW